MSKNKPKILVTGARTGVGRATADLLHSQGYEVYGISSQELSETVTWTYFQVDLGDSTNRIQDLQRLPIPLQEFDVLILNAGIGELGSVEETPVESSRKLFEVNYWSCVEMIKEVLPHWRERGCGRLIVLGSIVTELHFPFKAQYSASKSALTAFLDSLRYEVENFGIQISVLEPGWVRSEFHNRLSHNPQSLYSKRFKHFLDFKKDHNPKYPDGKDVAQIILSEIQHPSSFRIPVGPDAKFFFKVGRALPFKTREWLIRYLSRE